MILSPFNATSHAVEYSPANGEYASVSQNGIVSGIRPGVQHLTVTAGSDMRTISITVTEPSGNWVQVDSHSDRIIYSGSWTDNSETACINGLSKQTDDRYATADFTFIGTGCRWIGQMDSNYGSAILSVDGKPFAYVNASVSAGPQYQQTIFQINGLPSGEHTIRISAQDTWIEVDAFEYYVGSDPLSGAVNHLDIHPGVILLDSGESVTIVATAMQAARIAVYTDALSLAVENEQIATLSQNTEDGSMILTGVAPGETLLTVSLAGTSVINSKKISILQNGIQQIARMPVNEENPLLLVSIYAQTKNTEWMTDPTGQTVPKGVPAQGNLTVTGVWDMIPDDLKPHTAIQLHGDDFVGHGYGGNGDHDALWAWYGYFVDQAEEYNRNEPDTSKHINLYLTLMTGGTPISVAPVFFISMNGVLHQIAGVLADRVREAGRIQFGAAVAVAVVDLDRTARRTSAVAAVGVACNHRVDVRGIFLVLVSDGSAELRREVFIRCRQRERHGRCVDFLSLDRAAVFQLGDYNPGSLFCDKKAVHEAVCRALARRGLAKAESIKNRLDLYRVKAIAICHIRVGFRYRRIQKRKSRLHIRDVRLKLSRHGIRKVDSIERRFDCQIVVVGPTCRV